MTKQKYAIESQEYALKKAKEVVSYGMDDLQILGNLISIAIYENNFKEARKLIKNNETEENNENNNENVVNNIANTPLNTYLACGKYKKRYAQTSMTDSCKPVRIYKYYLK